MYIMRKKYNCISVVNITKAITIALFVILPSLLIAQQSPSIQSGVTFQWSDTQNNLSDPATIESVTINGTMYNTFVVPTSYELTRLGPDGNGPNRIIRNGNNTGGNSNSANWNSRATDAFQDKNLNHYFFANPNGRNICLDFEAAETTDAQKQTIFYNPSIPSNEGGVLAVTERGGNNCFYIEIWGTPVGGGPEQKLGETFVRNVGDYRNNCAFGVPANGSDYWKSGRCNENGQTIGIGLFYLSDIAPIGSKITKIVFCAATRDHGDGKFFLLQKYAVDQQDTQCLNTTFTGDVRVANNAPENSTYNITSPPTVPGESFTFNSDGTFTYVPSAGFVGDVVFEYEVCLPEPNTSVCDQATVTLTYVPEPPSPEIDVSCSSTNNFMISVTTPLGEEYEYSLNNGTYQASPDFTNLSEGSYTLTVKNKYTTCEIEYPNNPFTLTNLELAGTTTDVICNPDTTGAIDITASGGAPPYSYSWSNGATTEDLTNIAAGTYTVTVSDSNDCPISKEFTINQPTSPLSSTISKIDVLCNGDNSGEIDLTIEGGTPPYSILWNTNSSSEDLSELAAGNYNVTITDANNCSTTNQTTIEQPATALSGTATNINNVDCSENLNGSFTIEASGSTSPYIYSIDNGNTNQSSSLFENLTAGSYTVLITDANGCTFTVNSEIDIDDTENPQISIPLAITIEGCSVSEINTTNALFEYSETQSADVQTIFESNSEYNTSDDSNIQSITYIDTVTSSDSCPITVDRTFTVTDNCGNSASAIQTITIQDTTAPNLSIPADVTIECSEEESSTNTGEATGSDTCSTVTITQSDDETSACGNTKTIVRTWTATDECGNTTSADQTIVVEDTTPPIITIPVDVTIECGEDESSENTGLAKAEDDCGGLTISESDDITETCGNTKIIIRTWTAVDNCGNSISDSQTITVVDTTSPTFTVPADITIECDIDATDLSITGDVTNEADNCDPDLEASFSDSVADGSCDNESTITRTWSLTDACDNITTLVQTINVMDTTAPTFTVPTDITIECDDDATDLSITGDVTDEADNCDTDLEATFSDSVANGSCDNESTITRTWSLTDACDNITTLVQTINVIDTTAPTINIPASNIIVECDPNNNGEIQDWLDNNGGATASDSCGNVTWSNDFNGTTSDCSNAIEVIFTATDECGNTTTTNASYSIQDTSAPNILTQGSDLTVECDGSGNTNGLNDWLANNGGAIANDDCSALIWSNDFTELTDECGATGSATVTFTATDACGNSETTIAVFSIEDTTAPTFNETIDAIIDVECNNVPAPETLTATDNCGTATVTFQEIRTDGSCSYQYVLARTWTATDSCGNQTVVTQTVKVKDSTAPTFTVPDDITIDCDIDPNDLTITGDVTNETDNCDAGLEATYSDSVAAGKCTHESVISRTWSLTDACNNTTTLVQTINVIDTIVPTFTVPNDITIECDVDATDLTITGDVTDEADNCDTDLEATYSDSVANGSCANELIITRTWSLTDACENSTTLVQTINIVDTTAPIIDTSANNIIVECDGTGNNSEIQDWVDSNGGATASDSCGNVTWNNNYNGVVSDCSNPIEVIFTATDECGNSSTTSATYSIQDTNAPNISTQASDLVVECDGSGNTAELNDWLTNYGGAIASEDCSILTWSNNFTELSDECGATGSATVTFTATDACGNSEITIGVFTIEDTTAPTFNEALPADVDVECDAVPTAETLTANDNCGDATVTFEETTTAGVCDNAYTLTRTWTATDSCGNETVHSQNINVTDTSAPTFNESLPVDIDVECDAVPTAEILTASDNCGDASIEFEEEIINGTCMGDFIITRTWTAIDSCNNETVHTQIITVQDTTAPTIVVPDGEDVAYDETITVSCDEIPEVPELVFEDTCSNDMEVTFNEDSTQTNDFEDYQIIRTWYVVDDCDNEAVFTQTINVEISNIINAFDASRCVLDSEFDLFDLLSGDFNMNGTWSVISGDASLNGSFFDPSDVEIGMYTFMYSITEGPCPKEVEVNVTIDDDCVVLACGKDDVIISKTVTANGDTFNDFFTVGGIDQCGFVIELQIFNRWGAKIYESRNYQNDWNGDAHGSSVGSSGKVPTGTYYYVINLRNSGLEPFAGPIYVATK